MESFINFLHNYDSIMEAVKIRAAKRSGLKQYSAAARLIADRTGQPNTGWRHLKKIMKHFKDGSKTEYTDPTSGVSVGRYSAPDVRTGSFDITLKNQEGESEGVEVVSGGGKMFLSMRGHKPSETSTGVTTQQLQTKPGWAGIAAEYPKDAQTRLSATAPEDKPFRRVGSAFARNISTKKHAGMEEIEKNMKAKHWLIGNYMIPVGNLSHFVHRMTTTQGSPEDPRLAVRVANVIDPTKGSADVKKVGTEKSWHKELETILSGYSPNQLKQYGIQKIQ